MKCKRILCLLDGKEQIIIGTIRDTGTYAYGGDPDDGIAELIERDGDGEPIRLRWIQILEVSELAQ